MPHAAPRSSVSPFAVTEPIPTDDFHLLGVLGEGGNGTVYAARHRGADVALKVLRSELALSDKECSRFLDEAVRMRRLEHEGLVPLLGSGILSDGRPYLCMPRLRGETLAKRLTRGKLPLDQALPVFDKLAETVAVVHRAGLIHRDIKPENIFLEDLSDEGGPGGVPHPVLLDFGIARDVSDDASTTTAAGQTRGTPAYMAPERFFGAVANVRTDVYELAVTFYAMVTGRLPWDAANSAEARLSPVRPEDAGVDLPGELSRILLRALSTRPENRPESADSFADTVREAARGVERCGPRTTADVAVATDPAPAAAPARSEGTPTRRKGLGRWALLATSAPLAIAALLAPVMVGAGPAARPLAPPTPAAVVEAYAPPGEPSNPAVSAPPAGEPPAAAPAPARVSPPSPPSRPHRSPSAALLPADTPAPAASVPDDPARYYRDRK